jgi:hypothetical protein
MGNVEMIITKPHKALLQLLLSYKRYKNEIVFIKQLDLIIFIVTVLLLCENVGNFRWGQIQLRVLFPFIFMTFLINTLIIHTRLHP